MTITLEATAATEIGEAVAAAIHTLQGDDPLAEVAVVTPRGPTAQTLRRVLPHTGPHGGVVGIRFETPLDLAAEIVRSVDGPAPRVSPLVLSAAVEYHLDTDCPDALVKVRDNPTTVESIVGVADRVRLLPTGDDAAWFQPASEGRLALLTVARRALAQLRALGYRDERTIIDRAIELIADARVDLPVPDRLVVVASDCFHPAHLPLLIALLDRVGDGGRVVASTTITDDRDLATQIERLGGQPVIVERSAAVRAVPSLVSCPDHDEEVRHVLRSIAGLLRDRATAGPVELDDISILYPPGTGYHRAIVDELDRARIPWVGTAPHLLRESLGGTIVRLALATALDPTRVNVIRLATVAPFAPTRGAPPRTPGHWRRLARRLEVTNAGSWQRARELVASSADGAPVEDLNGRELSPRDITALARLIEFVDRAVAVGEVLRAVDTDWARASRVVVGYIDYLTGDLGRGLWARVENWQLRAVEQIGGGLALLASLSGDALGDLRLEYGVADLARMVEQLLDQPVRRVNTNGTGVRVRPTSDGVCLDDRVIFVVGANDGTLPPSRSDDLFAPSPEDPEAAFVEHAYWRQRQVERAWYRLFDGRTAVTVTWARADLRRGGAIFPSRLVADVADAPVETIERPVDSHAAELLEGPSLSLADEMVRTPHGWRHDEVLRRRVAAQVGRTGSELTAYDGDVGPGAVSLAETTLSVTHLEGLATCGLSYLYRQVLGVYEDDDPVDAQSISALNRGDLLHDTLETIVEEWLALPEPRPAWLGADHVSAIVGSTDPGPPTRRDLVESAFVPHEQALRQTGALGHAARWMIERELMLDGIVGVLAGDDGERAVPVAAEHAFGFGEGSAKPFPYTASGVEVTFRGKIDRIDVVAGTSTRVTDYKTTSRTTFPTISKTDPTEGGTKLQLPLYARVAARDFGSRQPDAEAPRYLYVRGDEVAPREAPALADEHLDHFLDLLIARVAAGDFHPGEPDSMWGCRFCSPDGLGLEAVTERLRRLDLPVPHPGESDDDASAADATPDSASGPVVDVDPDVFAVQLPSVPGPVGRAATGSPAGELADAAEREQVVSGVGRPFVVVAGAGSGKTTVLVERVASEIANDPKVVGRLVIITFTEKAARELTHRLRERCPGVDFDEAYVGTIHGFCSSILRRYPIEAGLPTRFEAVGDLASATDAADRAESQVARLFDSIGGDAADPRLVEALAALARVNALRHLPTLATVLDQKWDQVDAATLPRPRTDSELRTAIAAVTADARAIATSSTIVEHPDDPLSVYLRDEFLPWLDGLPTDLPHLARAALPRPGGVGRKKAWASAKEVRDTVAAAVAAVPNVAIDEAMRRVLAALVEIVRADAEQRIASGVITYDDLLILTRRLLGDPRQRSVLDELRSSIRQVYVDEFQDTDDVQFDIIADLCGVARVDGTAAADTPHPPAVLVLVGDPKQAIYGFRDANPTLLTERADAVDHAVDLVTNFRSQPGVCSWINAVMSTRFDEIGGSGSDGVRIPYQDLDPYRPEVPDAAPAVALIGFDDANAPQPRIHDAAADVGHAEGNDIAATITQMTAHDPGDGVGAPWRVGSEGVRPACGDIAILVRGRGALTPIESALRAASIPYRVEGGTLLYESREVYELLRVLTALEHPNDDHAVVTALRTSIFGLTDPQLVAFRRVFRYWNVPSPARLKQVVDEGDIESTRPVVEALASLRRWSSLRTTLNPAQLFAAIYDATFGAAAARHAERDAAVETWRRVRFVIDEARAWVDEYAGTLGEYLEWVGARIDRVDRSEMSTGENEDSVRIMTIHAAKGLEFPIVFVAGLGRNDPNESGVRVATVDGGLEVTFNRDVRTLGFPGSDVDAAHAEEARLLYVAFTRAMDHLIVSGHTSKRSHHNAIRRLAGAIAKVPAAVIAAPDAGQGRHPDAFDGGVDLTADPHSNETASVEFVPLAADPRRTVWTPSALAHSWNEGRAHPDDQPAPSALGDDTDPGDVPAVTADDWAIYAHDPTDPGLRKDPGSGVIAERTKGRYGTSIGTAVHEVLQMVDLSDPRRHLETLAVEAAANADVSDVDTIVALATSIIDSDLFAELAAARSVRREVYVGASLGSSRDDRITVWGYIDALFERADGLVVVDFKTDSATASDATLIDRYRAQLSGYARAAERATGHQVAAAYLLVARRDGRPASAIEVTDLLPADELVPSGAPAHVGGADNSGRR